MGDARKAPGHDGAGEAQVVERGDVFFFYRPRVEQHAPRGEDDVQRLLVVLAPDGRRVLRLVTIGRKHLPTVSAKRRERNWGFVMKVAGAPEDLELELRGHRYLTKTRGEREQPSARPAGEGRYAIARHGGHTHLAYALARPGEPGEVQRELGIEASASFVVAVKNPWWPTPARANAGLAPEAEAAYPDDVQAAFRGRRWAPLDPAHLDREGAEVVLVGTGEDPDEELGIELDPAERSGDVFRRLGLDPERHPVAARHSRGGGRRSASQGGTLERRGGERWQRRS
jgi:hypothetical protein